MNIAVYLGSTSGNKKEFSFAARSFGRWIGKNGHTLVYGGANRGLMGDVADAVLESGGKVIGVIPDVDRIQERKHDGLTQLIETSPMTWKRLQDSLMSDS